MRSENRNLLPAVGDDGWKTVTPAFKEIAGFSADAEAQTLEITLDSEAYGMGKWVCEADVMPGWYAFSVSCRTDKSMHDIYVLITVLRADGRMITRDHAKYDEKTDDGWRFTDPVHVPEDGVKVRVELWLKGYHGAVKWNAPVLIPAEAPGSRKVTMAMGYIRSAVKTAEEQAEQILAAIDMCAGHRADVIVLSESMYGRGMNLTYPERAESLDGALITAVCARAARYHAYIIYNFVEHTGTEYYNSSALIDREGTIVGTYHKTHLTIGELEGGLTPGHEHPVFDTDFGRVGMLTCYDQYFPEPAMDLAMKGAEIIFVPTAGDARDKSSARAMDGGVYMAIAGNNSAADQYRFYEWDGWKPARIISPNGIVLAQTGTHMEAAVCTVDLSERTRLFWLSVGAAEADVQGVYRREKNPASYR